MLEKSFFPTNIFRSVVVFFFITVNLFPQEKVYNLDEIVVTAGRTAGRFSETTRDIQIIRQEDIAIAPVSSVQELLQYISGVDIKQRGAGGVQADISLRGGTFEQTLVMLDGISVNDPQTAHHNLNLPVSLDQIERIEIVKGDGSSSYGPNALGGIINIITKKGNEKSATIQLTGGGFGFYDAALSGSYGFSSMSNHFSFSKKKSDGYRDNTNFEMVNASYGSSVLLGKQLFNLFFGYNDKKFGANGFYSDKYPNQWEHTTTRLASVSGEVNTHNIVFSPKIYWRRNDDEYLLNYLNPSFYRNVHKTNVYGAELQAAFQTGLGTTAFGAEYNRDVIASSNLGDHSRERRGLFAEQKLAFKNMNAVLGFFAYNYANIGWKFWPGVSVGYNVFPAARIYASFGKAFRLPSYTELYYNYFVTPKNGTQKGNPDLQTEESTNYEVGMHFSGEDFSSSFSLFRRNGYNSIDWGKASTDSVWHSYNIVNTVTSGFEVNTELKTEEITLHTIKKVTIGYTYLNISASLNKENFESRYVLDHLRHQLIVGVTNALFFDITQTWMLRYENRITGDKNFLVDSQINKAFTNVDVFVKATNLFNKSYKDFTGVFLPGRWVFAGIKLSVQ
ncbi:MAG: TonB-dependent receptor [Ignavibacteriaceae bacterium]|jgi:iron complex outermembrane receptor protein